MPDQQLTDQILSQLLVHGPRPVHVQLSEYGPIWPERYERPAEEVRAALGPRVKLIEHTGSTSVPGLAAKNVVDIVIGIDDPDDEASYRPALADLATNFAFASPSAGAFARATPGRRRAGFGPATRCR